MLSSAAFSFVRASGARPSPNAATVAALSPRFSRYPRAAAPPVLASCSVNHAAARAVTSCSPAAALARSCPSGDSSGISSPASTASVSIASRKARPSCFITQSMTLPCSPQPKQW